MRRVAGFALVLLMLSGCSSPSQDDGDDPAGDAIDRQGVVVLNQDYTVTFGQESDYATTFTGKERNVILEIRQDSGVLPNLHVEVGGCGEVDPPASAGWQTHPLCDSTTAHSTQVTITIRSGGATGSGSFIVRADMVA